jgi:hypothetical protein
MPDQKSRLSALQIARLTKPGKHHVGEGLYAQNKGASKTWLARCQFNHKAHWLGLAARERLSA